MDHFNTDSAEQHPGFLDRPRESPSESAAEVIEGTGHDTSPQTPTSTVKKKTSRQNLYIGKAGHLAVMAEFALLGYNVSLPEVDKGDDVYVVNEFSGQLWRVQVKGATIQTQGKNYQVIILESQVTRAPINDAPDLHFVFALRQVDRWQFIVMSRKTLKSYIDERENAGKSFGHLNKKSHRRTLTITFRKNKKGEVSCSYAKWTEHLQDWSEWPYLDHEKLKAEQYTTDTTKPF